MMPTYAANGQVCEIGLEKRRYSPEVIRLDADMSDKDLNEIVDEFAPADERGPRDDGLHGADMTLGDGGGMTTLRDYENVSVQIFGHVLNNARRDTKVEANIAAVIKWKNRNCE